jgi:hypothetical protein
MSTTETRKGAHIALPTVVFSVAATMILGLLGKARFFHDPAALSPRLLLIFFVVSVLTVSLLAFFIARGFLLGARVGAMLVILFPGIILLLIQIWPTFRLAGKETLLANFIFELLFLIGGIILVMNLTYPDRAPAPEIDAAPGPEPPRPGPKTIDDFAMPSPPFGRPVAIPNWRDPVTELSAGPRGNAFEIYACPNAAGHGGKPFYLSKASWWMKNFRCPVCNESITAEWRPKPKA